MATADNTTGGMNANAGGAGQDARDTITRIWEQVLRLDDLRPENNFFELGGHSLAASQVSSRIHDTLGVEVSLAVFFERPTIAELTMYVLQVMFGSAL